MVQQQLKLDNAAEQAGTSTTFSNVFFDRGFYHGFA
jgi:hypothetical protein